MQTYTTTQPNLNNKISQEATEEDRLIINYSIVVSYQINLFAIGMKDDVDDVDDDGGKENGKMNRDTRPDHAQVTHA